MALTASPARASKWIIEIVGLAQWSAQKVTLPDFNITSVEHGGTDGATVKTAGRKEIGELVIEKLVPINDKDFFSYAWLLECLTGLPDVYKKVVRVHRLGADGITRTQTYDYFGVFPTGLNRSDLDRLADENFMETLTCSVDDEIQS